MPEINPQETNKEDAVDVLEKISKTNPELYDDAFSVIAQITEARQRDIFLENDTCLKELLDIENKSPEDIRAMLKSIMVQLNQKGARLPKNFVKDFPTKKFAE